ncbi:MAG TPA: hypothetical protein VGG54_22505 [Trebonia sp.]|jgi:hypothetical protein
MQIEVVSGGGTKPGSPLIACGRTMIGVHSASGARALREAAQAGDSAAVAGLILAWSRKISRPEHATAREEDGTLIWYGRLDGDAAPENPDDGDGRLSFLAFHRERFPDATPTPWDHAALTEHARKAWRAAQEAGAAPVRAELHRAQESLEVCVDALQAVALSGDEKLRALVLEALARAQGARQ